MAAAAVVPAVEKNSGDWLDEVLSNVMHHLASTLVGVPLGITRRLISSPATTETEFVLSIPVVSEAPVTVTVRLVAAPFFITVKAYDLLAPAVPVSLMRRFFSEPAAETT